jgi:hypothetical protein
MEVVAQPHQCTCLIQQDCISVVLILIAQLIQDLLLVQLYLESFQRVLMLVHFNLLRLKVMRTYPGHKQALVVR